MFGARMATAAVIGGAMSFGMALALLGERKAAAARSRSLSGGTWFALNLAIPVSVLLGGILLDIYGERAILVAGSTTLAVALAALSLRPTAPHAIISMPLAVFGAANVGVAIIALMSRVLFAPEEMTASLNLGFVFFALGSLPTPILAELLVEKLHPRRTLAAFALLALLPAFLAVLPDSEPWPRSDPSSAATHLMAEPKLWLAASVMFFYVPLEAAIGLWTFASMQERRHDAAEEARLLSYFWAASIASRLLIAVAQHLGFSIEGWDRFLIVIPPLLAGALLGNLLGATSLGRMRAGMVLLGMLLGPVMPTLLAILFHDVATGKEGTVLGFVFVAGSLGSALLAPIVAPRTSITLRLPIFLALSVAAAGLVMGLIGQ